MVTNRVAPTDAEHPVLKGGTKYSGRVPGLGGFEWGTDEGKSISIWNNVDGTWTKPIDQKTVYQIYIRKLVYICSLKDYSSTEPNIDNHIESLKRSTDLHVGATLEREIGGTGVSVDRCSGCGETFQIAKGQSRQHLAKYDGRVLSDHSGARQQEIVMFSLSPSEPKILSEGPVLYTNGVVEDNGVDVHKSEESPRQPGPGKRRRRRGKRSR